MINKKTIVMSFNKEYIKYAIMAIYSILVSNPSYEINCLAVNTHTLHYYPFNNNRVKIVYLQKSFEAPKFISPNKPHNYDPERCFMTTCRFDFAHSLMHKYNIIIILDVDSIVIKPFVEIEEEIIDKDIAVIKVTDKEPDYSKYSAAFIVFNTLNIDYINRWFIAWKQEIEKLDLYFFNDQLAMYKTIQRCDLKYLNLPLKKYCSFIKYLETIIVMTSGRIKETRSVDYNNECNRIKSEMQNQRRTLCRQEEK